MSRYVCSPVQNNNTYQREKKLGENYFETWLLEPKSNAVIVTWWVFDRPIQGAQAGALGRCGRDVGMSRHDNTDR